LGEAGIAAKLDPDFVQAIREMDELEGVVEPRIAIEAGSTAGEDEDDGRASKRARIESRPAQAPLPIEPPPAPQQTGLLSAHALESLRYVAALKQAQPANAAYKPTKPGGLQALADYGSDDE